nr:Ig-like domain-containing protein [Pirellulaceae bacterium]
MKTRTRVIYRGLPAVAMVLVTMAWGQGAADVGPREVTAGFPGPKPGEVFREYVWTKAGDGGFLRVGGRLGYGGGPVMWPHDFDLFHARRAEVVLEKLLCHDGTRGLALSVNGHAWIPVPEAAGIAEPPWDYQHHVYPVVPVPLDQFQAGTSNQFRLRVSDEHPWKWPQNLLYGVHVRIYYDAAKKSHPTGRLLTPKPGTALGTKVDLAAEAASPDGSIRQVDFLGQYEDVNLEGDGEYSQWHGHHVKGKWKNHIGTVTAAPWKLTWDTSWVPDQPRPFRLAARITDESGLTYFTDAVEGLTFQRPGLAVELCTPYDVPKKWVTREDEKAERFRVSGNLRDAVAAQLVWTSWSPGYMDGLYLN